MMFELLPLQIPIRRMGEHCLPLPRRESAGAAGYDLRTSETLTIYAGGICAANTGWAFQLPKGYVGLIRDRSGLAIRGITTRAGVIDQDYRGEVRVVLVNETNDAIVLPSGERIAQLLIMPVEFPDLLEVAELVAPTRGAGGFGSTGRQ